MNEQTMPVPKQLRVRPLILVMLISTLAFVAWIVVLFVHPIPDRARTRTTIAVLSHRVELYLHQNETLPGDLQGLPEREEYHNEITDAWDRPLLYRRVRDEAFEITSYGPDGKQGGSGDTADIRQWFHVVNGQVEPADGPPAAPPFDETTPATASDLEAMVAEHGSVTFLSDNGHWHGMDNDSDITFLPAGDLHVFNYGYAMIGYRGRYEVDAEGNVTVDLQIAGHPWPNMMLRSNGGDLLLYPFLPDEPGTWPYRQIPPADVAQQRQDIATRGAPVAE